MMKRKIVLRVPKKIPTRWVVWYGFDRYHVPWYIGYWDDDPSQGMFTRLKDAQAAAAALDPVKYPCQRIDRYGDDVRTVYKNY